MNRREALLAIAAAPPSLWLPYEDCTWNELAESMANWQAGTNVNPDEGPSAAFEPRGRVAFNPRVSLVWGLTGDPQPREALGRGWSTCRTTWVCFTNTKG